MSGNSGERVLLFSLYLMGHCAAQKAQLIEPEGVERSAASGTGNEYSH